MLRTSLRRWRKRPIATRSRTQSLTRSLLGARQMTSLMDKELAEALGDVRPERADWVPMLVDHGYVVTSDCGGMSAKRAITVDGVFLWYVLRPGKRVGYHAQGGCPVAAFEETREALARRRDAREHWPMVEAFARDLRWGRARDRVTRDHVNASGLCVHGIDHFSRVFGLTGVPSVPGAVIAWLMLIEPQLGMILYQAIRARREEVAPLLAQASASR